jgi:Leucine-rich repeat (LRR) protein
LPNKDKLHLLLISDNQINEIGVLRDIIELFKKFPNLKRINLSGNPISELSDEKEEISILDGIGTLSGEELQQLLDLVSEKKVNLKDCHDIPHFIF